MFRVGSKKSQAPGLSAFLLTGFCMESRGELWFESLQEIVYILYDRFAQIFHLFLELLLPFHDPLGIVLCMFQMAFECVDNLFLTLF